MGIKICDTRWHELSPFLEALFKEAHILGFKDGYKAANEEKVSGDE